MRLNIQRLNGRIFGGGFLYFPAAIFLCALFLFREEKSNGVDFSSSSCKNKIAFIAASPYCALSLKRNLPHIVVVTGEPMPSRLATLALGTGDIDCMYHFALYGLMKTVKATQSEDSIEMLDVLIKGKRLKDISDLPLDLAV